MSHFRVISPCFGRLFFLKITFGCKEKNDIRRFLSRISQGRGEHDIALPVTYWSWEQPTGTYYHGSKSQFFPRNPFARQNSEQRSWKFGMWLWGWFSISNECCQTQGLKLFIISHKKSKIHGTLKGSSCFNLALLFYLIAPHMSKLKELCCFFYVFAL